MMATTDWPPIDAAAVTLPGSELFGGELFGDELIEMYNAEAGVENSAVDINENINEIPTILPDPPDNQKEFIAKASPEIVPSSDSGQTGASASNTNSVDDGLGAFRPSTSFNDFTHLQAVADNAIAPAQEPAPMAPPQDEVMSPLEGDGEKAGSKKRARSEEVDGGISHSPLQESGAYLEDSPSPKRRASQGPPPVQAVVSVPAVQVAAAAVPVATPTAVVTGPASVNQSLPNEAVTTAASHVKQEIAQSATAPPPPQDTPNPLALKKPLPSSVMGVHPAVITPNTASAVTVTKPVALQPAANPSQTCSKTAVVNKVPVQSRPDVVSSNCVATAKPATTTPATKLPVYAPSQPVAKPGGMCVAASSKPPETLSKEDSFKGVAQAAVTNLILNASASSSSQAPGTEGLTVTDDDSDHSINAGVPQAVDTSTAHVVALTSSNWVAACNASSASSVASGPSGAAGPSDQSAASKAARARRANLTPDERARQNRDRNREHARNTRLRKKAYVEELKRTLTELVAQRDAADLEKRHEAQRDLEVREVRFRVMEEFLKLRSRGDEPGLLQRWVAILDDSFKLTLPRTDYRAMINSGANKAPETANGDRVDQSSHLVQVLTGAAEVMEDSAHVSAFAKLYGEEAVRSGGCSSTHPVRVSYTCDRKSFLMDSCDAVITWTASTVGAATQGGAAELSITGTMRATFSPISNKLVSAELLFDTGCISSQLKALAGMNDDVDSHIVVSGDPDPSALLDSLQMPNLPTQPLGSEVPSTQAIALTAPQASLLSPPDVAVVSSSEKGDSSSDESNDECASNISCKVEGGEAIAPGMVTRRSARRQEAKS